MSFIKGERINLVKRIDTLTITWKQCSMFGIGGDRVKTYGLHEYELNSGGRIQVYIEEGFKVHNSVNVDSRFRFGMNDGVFFLVLDNHENQPYQHRFVQNTMQKAAYAVNEDLKRIRCIDLSWVTGDYLRNIE